MPSFSLTEKQKEYVREAHHRWNFAEGDGRAYTPIMKPFGRAAIPTTTYEGVKSIIDRKMKAGEISRPWEIFENLLGEKAYGARGRKAD
ncbi:MAG: hypothetical protein [Bacteriophage sp.]|nr:MAG: hypothetical protein [Bacteriophage sp.]